MLSTPFHNRYPAAFCGVEAHSLGMVESACWANRPFHRAMFRALMRRRRTATGGHGWRNNYRLLTAAAREHLQMYREAQGPRWFRVVHTMQPPQRVTVREGDLALVVTLSDDDGACLARWYYGEREIKGAVDLCNLIEDRQRAAARALVPAAE